MHRRMARIYISKATNSLSCSPAMTSSSSSSSSLHFYRRRIFCPSATTTDGRNLRRVPSVPGPSSWKPGHYHYHHHRSMASATPDNDRLSSSSSSSDHHHHHHRSWREQYHERSQAFRDSVDDRREALRDRATHYRDSAATKLREFQENPQQTALAGAKSFTSMLRMYGPVFIGTYGVVYFTTLATLYAGVASGVLDPVALFTTLGIIPTTAVAAAAPDAVAATTAAAVTTNTTITTVDLVYNFLDHHEITKSYAHYVQDYPALANFGVAWISVKFTEPIRLPVAISITPRVARYIGYRPPLEKNDTGTKNGDENDMSDNSSSSSSTTLSSATKSSSTP